MIIPEFGIIIWSHSNIEEYTNYDDDEVKCEREDVGR